MINPKWQNLFPPWAERDRWQIGNGISCTTGDTRRINK